MANINNTSSYMDEDKKQIIKESNYTYRDALEVSAYLIEAGKDAFDGGLGHAAGGLHFFDVGAGPLCQLFGEPLNVVGAGPRVDGPHRAGFLLQQQLGVPGNAGGEVGGQGQRLIQRVGVQRLGVALGCGHGLNAGARHVIEHVLGGQRPAGCLRVCAQ